jgi:hypothetical protein
MVAAYPVVALTRGHGLSIGLTSYNGGVFFGINADRDGVPDVDELAQCLKDALTEMKDSTKGVVGLASGSLRPGGEYQRLPHPGRRRVANRLPELPETLDSCSGRQRPVQVNERTVSPNSATGAGLAP